MGDSQQSLQAYSIEQQQVRVASYPELKFVTDEFKKKITQSDVISVFLRFLLFFTDERESAIPAGTSYWGTAGARGHHTMNH